jgi:hypothetical protein
VACNSFNGMYCDSSVSQCAPSPITACAKTDGSSASSVTCKCGNGTTAAKTIKIQTTDDGIYTAQDTPVYNCGIKHTVKSSVGTALGTENLQLTTRSIGCGRGEHFGPRTSFFGVQW